MNSCVLSEPARDNPSLSPRGLLALTLLLVGVLVLVMGYGVSQEFEALAAQEIERVELSAMGKQLFVNTIRVHPWLEGASPSDIAMRGLRINRIGLVFGALVSTLR